MTAETTRKGAYGQHVANTPVDRFGVWLSGVAVRRHGAFAGRRIADLGCGFNASFTRTVLPQAESALLVDLALADDLKRHPRVEAIEGSLPDVLPQLGSSSLDTVLCLSVLEHLWEPQEALLHIRRILAPGGIALLNVPSWRGKRFLELAAFRLGVSPAEEMDDHKSYYDPRDLWPLLVRAGFRPSAIHCRRHKLGLNTFAACRVPATR
ncbi:MAG: Methyltransferase type 11 [Conexibacter sp.]|nr:Methyltransferase type 11 [Conexibacter sp.]